MCQIMLKILGTFEVYRRWSRCRACYAYNQLEGCSFLVVKEHKVYCNKSSICILQCIRKAHVGLDLSRSASSVILLLPQQGPAITSSLMPGSSPL